MNTLGHKFFKEVNNCPIESDSIEICNESNYYICKTCNLNVFIFKASVYNPISIYSADGYGKITITCNEMIIKKLLE